MNSKTTRRTATLVSALALSLLRTLAAHGQDIDPGLLPIDLGISHQTFLGISPSSLETDLCDYSPPNGDTKDPKLLASNDGSHRQNVLSLAVTAAHPIGDGSTVEVAVETAGFQLIGAAPLSTVCGSWTYRIVFDERAALPPSNTLTLHRVGPTDSVGVFVGSVSFGAKIECTHVDTLEVREVPLAMSLDLQGPWAAAASKGGSPPRGRQAPALAATNLALFAGVVDGEFKPLSTPNVQRTVEYGAAQGQIVLQAAAESIAALNGW